MTLISTQDLSDYIGRDLSADAGALLAVESADQLVRTLTEQDFEPLTSTVYLDGTGTDAIFLPQRPVNAVGTVTVNGTIDTDFTFTADGRLTRADSGESYATWTEQPAGYWPAGRQNIAVTYEHGGTVPEDVRMVAIMAAYRLVTQGGAISEQVGGVTRRYAIAAGDLSAAERAILRRYRGR